MSGEAKLGALLNVAVTGPYGHAGGYNNLHDVIRHHLNPRAAIEGYDLNQLERLQASGDSKLTNINLGADEVD